MNTSAPDNMLYYDNQRLRKALEEVQNRIGSLALMANDATGYSLTRQCLSGCLDLIRETINTPQATSATAETYGSGGATARLSV